MINFTFPLLCNSFDLMPSVGVRRTTVRGHAVIPRQTSCTVSLKRFAVFDMGTQAGIHKSSRKSCNLQSKCAISVKI